MKYNLYLVYECSNIWFRCWYSYIHCYYYQILNKKNEKQLVLNLWVYTEHFLYYISYDPYIEFDILVNMTNSLKSR